MRVKIILPNFIAILLLGLGSFFYLKTDLRTKAENRLKKQMQITSSLNARSDALGGFELLNNVRSHAMSRDVVNAFAPVDVESIEGASQEAVDSKIRSEWFKKCVRAVEVYTEILVEKTGKRPGLVFLTDRKGVVVARNITPGACPSGHNVAKAIPAVSRALDGEATYAVWSIDESPFSTKKPDSKYCRLMTAGLMEIATAPVWYGEDIAGALVVGFEISNGTAQKKADLVNLDVAVLSGGEVYSSSFKTDKARQSLEQQLDKADVKSRIESAVKAGKRSEVFNIAVEGDPYLALISPVVGAEKQDKVATILMGSVDKAAADTGSLKSILILMIVVLIIVFAIGVALSNHFLTPVMAIEEGLLKVINGEFQYRFDVKSAEVGGLSYRINQLIGVLTGEDEIDDEED